MHVTEKEPYLILQPESESHYTVASGVSRSPCRMSLKSHKEKFNLRLNLTTSAVTDMSVNRIVHLGVVI